MELNGGGYACSGELSTAKSDFFSGKEGDLGRSTLEVGALLALCALYTRTHICVYGVCVCVRGYIQAEEPQAEPGEHKLSLGFVR